MLKGLICLVKGHTAFRPMSFYDQPFLYHDVIMTNADGTERSRDRIVTVDVCARCGKLYAKINEKE